MSFFHLLNGFRPLLKDDNECRHSGANCRESSDGRRGKSLERLFDRTEQSLKSVERHSEDTDSANGLADVRIELPNRLTDIVDVTNCTFDPKFPSTVISASRQNRRNRRSRFLVGEGLLIQLRCPIGFAERIRHALHVPSRLLRSGLSDLELYLRLVSHDALYVIAMKSESCVSAELNTPSKFRRYRATLPRSLTAGIG